MQDMNDLSQILFDMFPNDEIAVEKALQVLRSEPKYLEAFRGLKTSPPAMRAFLCKLIGVKPSSEPASRPDEEILHDQAESMRAEYREFIGTEIVESEEPWVFIPDLPPHVQIFVQGAGASAFFTGQQFAQRAAEAGSDTMQILHTATEKIAGVWIPSTIQTPPVLALNRSNWLMNGGAVLTVGFFGYECYGHIRQYWIQKIDSYELAGKLMTSLASAVGAAVGAWSGASIMVGAGPWGVGFGALVGALIGSEMAKKATRKLFVQFFGTSRERALRNAYSTLSLFENAFPTQIRKQYLKLARECHPDKASGNHERFVLVNCAYELIGASRLQA